MKNPPKVTNLYWLASDRDVDSPYIEGGKRVLEPDYQQTDPPFFSVVTICRNNANELRQVIESVQSQSYKSFEHIIIDGDSDDFTINYLSTVESVVDYFISEADNGIYNAINKGLSFCRGAYIVLIHADDILKSDALKHAHQVIMSTSCDVALGDSIYFDGNRSVAYKPARDYGEETILRGIVGPHEAAFISADSYDDLGGYDETYRIAADFKFLRNCILHGKLLRKIDRVVNFKKVGGDSFDKALENSENRRLLKEIFPSLSDEHCKILYALKNYQKVSVDMFRALFDLVDDKSYPAALYRNISKALIDVQVGDGPQQASNDDYRRKARKVIDSAFESESIVLAIGKIKGVSGGAERVLIELANHLSMNGYSVVVVCMDGKPLNLFYDLSFNVELIDLNEQPFTSFLSNHHKLDLSKTISKLIEDAPDDLLMVADSDLYIRQACSSWENFLANYSSARQFDRDKIIQQLHSEVPQWLSRYEQNVQRFSALIDLTRPKLVVPFMISCIQQIFLANKVISSPSTLVLSNHNNPSRDYFQQDEWCALGVDRLLRFLAASTADATAWLLDEYIDYMPPQYRDNSVVIPNPITPRDNIRSYEIREPLLLAVGRLTDIKNFQLLISAFQLISGSFPEWKLAIYGAGPQEENLNELVNEFGLSAQVSINAPTKNIFALYNRASIFVSSSLVEGFPLTLSEAFSFGLPAMGLSECSGVNTLIQDGYNGILVKPDETGMLTYNYSLQLAALIKDYGKRKVMSENALVSIKKYSPQIVYDKWKKLLS